MAPVGEILARAKSSIRHPGGAMALLLQKLDDLQARLDEGLLRVAALGQFKRGKSTLLNALLGAPLLPMGVTPVTALPTFIRAGDRTRVRVVLDDEHKSVVQGEGDEVAEIIDLFSSEARNPHNRRRVASVSLDVPSDLLAQGVMLIDTPGVGSTHRHNTTAAEAALAQCDAAIFVLSADPPITEVEVDYLEKIRRLIPRVLFVLNKADLLDRGEQAAAMQFLDSVLKQRAIAAPDGVFPLSARLGLRARLDGDARALEQSGMARLEKALTGDLARGKRAILDVTLRARAIDLLADMRFQAELEYRALLTPDAELRRKAEIFEASVRSFEEERRRLTDFLALDRKRLLRELESETDRVWGEARKEAARLIGEIDQTNVETREARDRIAQALARHFEAALGESVRLVRERMQAAALEHRKRAGALIELARKTAADLLEIAAPPPPNEDVLKLRREPYWSAPEPSLSIIDASASALSRLLPAALRQKRARERLIADTERAALRNVANLDWSLRQNIGDSLRDFERALGERLGGALDSTREALKMAIEKRAARGAAIESAAAEAKGVVEALSGLSQELRAAPLEGAPLC
ncbi:dynamin family protein [Rhodoblastus sp.]|uniref:dynamin family protein n=1 Tax=Rhodoblastus sp. TaxID=1962975 RepID=UPI003F9C2858